MIRCIKNYLTRCFCQHLVYLEPKQIWVTTSLHNELVHPLLPTRKERIISHTSRTILELPVMLSSPAPLYRLTTMGGDIFVGLVH